MVRRSPNKTKKPQPAASGRGAAVPSEASFGFQGQAVLDPSMAPVLNPEDDADDGEPWSPTRSKLRSPTKPLAHQVTSLQQEKDELDNKLWGATVELQEHIRQKQIDDGLITRLQSELSKLRSEYARDSQDLDALRGRESDLESALQAAQDQAMQDKKSTLDKLESRDEYIAKLQAQLDALHGEVRSLNSAAAAAASAEKANVANEEAKADETSASWGFDTTEDHSFSGTIIPQTPGSNDLLASLGRQKRQQKALRGLLNKQRLENFDLRKQIAELKGGPVPVWDPQDEEGSIESLEPFAASGDDSTIPHIHIPPELSGENGRFTLGDDLMGEDADDEYIEKPRSSTVPPPSTGSVSSTVPPSLYSQARAFKHELVPLAKFKELSSRPPSQSAPVGFEEVKRLAAQLNYSLMSNEDYENINKLLHGKHDHAGKGVQSHVLRDLIRQNTFEWRTPTKIRAAWVASSDAPASVREYADKHDLALIPTSISAFEELASKLGLIIFPREELKDFSHGDNASALSGKNDDLLCRIPRAKLHAVRELVSTGPSNEHIYDLTRDEITSAAAAQGLTVMPIKQLERLQNDLGKLHSDEIPSAAKVADLAKKAGLQVIPENPTIDELQQVVNDDMVLVERNTYEALEAPGPATLTRLAKGYNMVVLPQSEVDQLRRSKQQQPQQQQSTVSPRATTAEDAGENAASNTSGTPDMSVDAIREIAEKKNLIVLSANDYQKMLKSRSTREFSHLPMSQRTQFFEELINSHGSATTSPSPRQSPVNSLGSMEDRARRMGFVLVTPEEYQQLKQSRQAYEPTKADVIQSAKNFGLVTMPIDEYSDLRAKKWKAVSQDRALSPLGSPKRHGEYSPSKADDEFKAVPANYLSALQRIAETPSRGDVKAMASKLGLRLLSSEEEDSMVSNHIKELGLAAPLTDDEIKTKAKSLGMVEPLTDEDIISRAKQLGLDYPLSDQRILSKAKELGLVEPLSENAILASAKKLGLVDPPSDEDIISKATKLGLVRPLSDTDTITKAKKLGLTEPLSDEAIISKAKQLGLAEPLKDNEIIAMAKKLGLVEPLSDKEVIAKAKKLGLVHPLSDADILSKAKKLGLIEPINDEGIVSKARSLGLIHPLSDEQIITKAKTLGLEKPLNDKEIVSKAQMLGLTKPLNDSEIASRAKNLGLAKKLSDDDIVEKAKKLGLVNPLTDAEIISKAKGLGLATPLHDNEIVAKAKALGMEKPLNKKEITEKAKQFGLAEPLSDSAIIAKAKSLGLAEPLSKGEIMAKAKELGMTLPFDNDQIIAKARKLGLVTPPSDKDTLVKAKKLGLVNPLSDKEIASKAENLGLRPALTDKEIIAHAEKLGLSRPLKESEIKSRAKSLGLVEPLTDSDIRERAAKLGLSKPLTNDQVLKKAGELGWVPEPSKDALVDKVKNLGIAINPNKETLIAEAKKLGLVEPYSDKTIRDKAKGLGMVDKPSEESILSSARNLGLVDRLSDDQLRAEGLKLGLTEPLSDDMISSKAAKLGMAKKLDDDEIIKRAEHIGLIFPPNDTSIISKAKELGLVYPPSDEEIKDRASKLGMASPSDNSPQTDSNQISEKLNENQYSPVRAADSGDSGRLQPSATHSDVDVFLTADRPSETAAAAIGPRRLPHSKGKMNLARTMNGSSPEPEEDSGPSTPLSSEDGVSYSPVSPPPMPTQIPSSSSSMRALSSLAQSPGPEHGKVSSTGLPETMSKTATPGRPTVRRYEVRGARSPLKTNRIPRSMTSNSIQSRLNATSAKVGPPSLLHQRSNSVSTASRNDAIGARALGGSAAASSRTRTGLSNWSVPSGDDIENMLSQTMVGEVHYKYYGGINFEGITGGRHRRYFWFRPETRILYWHRENPHLFANSNAKHITVIGVDEVVDRNPLPAGLYHRTLILKGLERDVHITCATQGRHIVWYSALRHVVSQHNERIPE